MLFKLSFYSEENGVSVDLYRLVWDDGESHGVKGFHFENIFDGGRVSEKPECIEVISRLDIE